MIRSYPKIFAIGTDYIRDLFANSVEITEKLDGSQMAFGKDLEGNFYMRSKGRQLFPELTDKNFLPAVIYAMSIRDRIPNDMVFYCETLARPKHNALKYNTVPKNHLYLFGASDYTGSKFFNRLLPSWAEELDIDCSRLFYEGLIENIDELKELLDSESYLGGTRIEGFVIVNYYQQFLLGGQPMPLMAGKWVSEEYKEVHRKDWDSHTTVGKWQAFKESYRTEARWEKAIQHLRDNGKLLNAPQDIGPLLKEIHTDITTEEIDTIKNFLWKEFGREVLSYACKGFPEFYKQKLAERSFEK